MNQLIIVGRLCSEPTYRENEHGTKLATITVAVNRSFKNTNGEYETDFIRCILWNQVASNVNEYCHKGDVVGVKGRLQTRSYEDKDGNKKFVMEVIAEKITFLSSAKKKEDSAENTADTTENVVENTEDPFKDFGDEVEISDDDLPF